MRRFAQADHEEREGGRIETCAERVEAVSDPRRFRQRGERQRQGSEPHRHVDGEKPRPRRDQQDQRGHRRPNREADADSQCVEPEAATEVARRINEADERDVDGHDCGSTQPLQHPGGHEARQRPRERAGERGEGEQGEAHDEDAALPDDLAQRRQRQQSGYHCKLVGVDDPDRGTRRDAEVGGDGGQRRVGDGGVDVRERDRAQDRSHGTGPLSRQQSVLSKGVGFGCAWCHR